jgi:hypothetical protein
MDLEIIFEGCAKLLEIIGMDKVKTIPIFLINACKLCFSNCLSYLVDGLLCPLKEFSFIEKFKYKKQPPTLHDKHKLKNNKP